MHLARRISRTRESATLGLTRRVKELEAAGAELIDLGAGEPSFGSPRPAIEAACRALEEGITGYTEVDGRLDLRSAIAARFRERGAPWSGVGDTLITVGAKAALFQLALALYDAGDEVVIPTPCWVSLPQQVSLAGATPVLVETDERDRFAIRAEPLIAALSDRTRAVLINSPCNPTGGLADAVALESLASACAQRGALLISDETYAAFVYDGARHASVADLAARYPETVVLVGSFSKAYAMTGWRLGYVLGPEPVITAARLVQGHATSNATSFAQPGALAAWLEAGDEVADNVARCQGHRDLVVATLSQIPGVRCPRPAGSFYAFADVSQRFEDQSSSATSLARTLLDEHGVVVVPGAAFGDDRYLRISFAGDVAALRTGLERIARAWT